MREHVITSLAILNVNWERRHDYIDNFVPFVAESLRLAQAEVPLHELQSAIAETFGLRIPQGALKTVLKRAVRYGYVKKTRGIYHRNENALATLDLSRVKASVLRQHEALIRKLTEFCQNRFQIHWSQEQAEDALLTYLQERSIPILAAAVNGQPILEPAQLVKHAEFVVNAFVQHLCSGDPEGFEFLATLVKGSMLANVLFFPDLGGVSQRFDRVNVYFDTTFLLRALLPSSDGENPCRELMDLLYELNGVLCCFVHTRDEILNVLHAAAHALRDRTHLRSARGETLEYFINSGYRASDVDLVIARLDRSLRALRVKVKPRPPYTIPLGLDEERLEATLQEKVRYHREETRRHDLDSLTAIHRLRRGQFPHRIELCDAIFVTTNVRLAQASGHFFREEYGDVAVLVPHCIPDDIFTTLVWLKKPLRAPELPRKKIIANCYAALNPPDTIWRLCLQEVDRLQQQGDISEEDYYLLRFSREARNIIMDITLGDPDAVTEETVGEVLEKARAAVRAPAEAALRAEREKRLEAERRAADAEAHAEAQRQAQLDRLRIISTYAGYLAGRIVLVVIITLLALATYLTFPEPFPDLPGEWWRFLVPLFFIVLAILQIADLVFGITIKSYIKELEVRVSHLIEQTLVRILIP